MNWAFLTDWWRWIEFHLFIKRNQIRGEMTTQNTQFKSFQILDEIVKGVRKGLASEKCEDIIQFFLLTCFVVSKGSGKFLIVWAARQFKVVSAIKSGMIERKSDNPGPKFLISFFFRSSYWYATFLNETKWCKMRRIWQNCKQDGPSPRAYSHPPTPNSA